MTGNAVINIAASIVRLLRTGFIVTGIAGIATQRCGVTGKADAISAAVIERESVGAIEGGRQPGRGSMARGAFQAEQAFMVIWVGMAGAALCGSALESVGVTPLAVQGGMGSGQWEF